MSGRKREVGSWESVRAKLVRTSRVLFRCWMVVLGLLAVGLSASAQTGSADEAAIRDALAKQVQAWNRGDIPGFMQGYEDSTETTFIGATVRKGYEPILERYKKNYSSRAQMGLLSFNDLEVRLLPGSCGKAEFAVVTGRFHLERSAKGEATKDDGVFSLVWHKGPDGWKIVLDHTS